MKCIRSELLRISKKRLNKVDIWKLYMIFKKLPYDDITFIRLFLDNYYNVELPKFYHKLFMYNVHSNRYNELFKILLNKDLYSLINYLNHDYENIYETIEENNFYNSYNSLPSKHIKHIVELIKSLDMENDKIILKNILDKKMKWALRKNYITNENEYTKLAINMFMSVGLDNSIDILLKKYGEIDYDILYFLFNNLKVNKSTDIGNLSFNEFLFNNKKDPNNNMRLMLEGRFLDLFVNFDYFYNSIDYFIKKLGTKFNKTKVSTLLKERYLAPIIENPEISGDVLSDMLSSYYNKYDINDTEDEVIDKNIVAYNKKLKTKTKSSIINADIPSDGEYIFELLPLNDVRNLVIGYRAGNCFRINGDAFVLFNNFLTNPHMRILSISTKEYKDFGMILLMRNGNALIAQGIEISKRIPKEVASEKLYNAVKNAINYIMEKMNNNGDEIVASIIGLTNNNTSIYNHDILPFIVNPILDNNNFYNGIDNYQGLLSLKGGKSINDIKLFVPSVSYHDNNIIYKRDKNTPKSSIEYQRIEKILISLRYARFQDNRYINFLYNKEELYTLCTSDWFIMVFDDGTMDSFINSSDPLIIEEYNLEIKNVKEKLEKDNSFGKNLERKLKL